ncbi:MAG: hypothetical protein K1X89_19480 [Myxococcaceae bacterium]|nr:hypothetical protein [Myxococcaceae bacterium]
MSQLKAAAEALDALLEQFSRRVSAAGTDVVLDGQRLHQADATARVALEVQHSGFRRASGAWRPPGRASGDSGWVAHLSSLTRGAHGWEPGYRLTKQGQLEGPWGSKYAYVSNGTITLYLDEPGQLHPADAHVGDPVAARVPRARENLTPHRFTLLGGQGGPRPNEARVKLFLGATLEGATALVQLLATRAVDPLAFALSVGNEPRELERADSVVLDLPPRDEVPVTRLVLDAVRANPGWVRHQPAPLFTRQVAPGVARADTRHAADDADGYGWRWSYHLADAVVKGLRAGESSPARWRSRFEGRG